MMTQAKARKFLQHYPTETLVRWFVDLVCWRWPEDLPFFPNPLETLSPSQNVIDQMQVVSDPVWISFFVALHDLTPREERLQALAEREALERIYCVLGLPEWPSFFSQEARS